MSSEKTSNGDMAVDMIIRAGTLLTMNSDMEVVHDALVMIAGDKIVDIRTWQGEQDLALWEKVEILDASDCLVLPGLINCHTHAAMTLFRGYADDLPLKQWLFEKIFPAEARILSPETVFWGAMLGFVEMIASGTTCFLDGYFYQDHTMAAALKVGIRGLAAQGVIDFPAPGVPDSSKNLEVGEAFLEKWSGESKLVRPGLFCHSPVTCSDKTLRKAMEISQRYGVPMQIHLSETNEEVQEIQERKNQRPLFYLEELGILNSNLIAAHAIHLDEREIDKLAQNETKVVHVPESNMKLASGPAKIPLMLKRGITIGLGTDGCASNNNLDLFQEMDTAAKLSKVISKSPEVLDARTVLKMATRWGARVLGLQDEIGSIEIGKKADIITIDLQGPHLQPLYDPYSLLVYSASGGDVRDVILNGKLLFRNREFISLDLEEIKAKVRQITKSLKNAG